MTSNDSIRVLRLITRLNIGGPSIQAINLSERLTRRGFDTLLVHGRLAAGEGDMRYLLPPTVETRDIPSLHRSVAPLDDAQTLIALYRLLCRVRPAIVHTHMAKAGTLGRLAAAMYNRTVGRRGRARVIHTYHGHVLEGYFSPAVARFFTATERQLSRVTDALVVVSPKIRRELLEEHRIGRAGQYHVIPLGFDLQAFLAIDDAARSAARAALDIGSDELVVSTVGRLTAIKQHQLFLEAARRIAERHRAVVFVIAGDGELREPLERQARELGLSTRTRFLGWRRDLATIYGATDVFLLTSRNEGTPVAVIESLASGVPAVSTDVGGVRDVLEDGETGLLTPYGDAERLAGAVGALLDDGVRRRAMGALGRDRVARRYSIERLTDDHEALYRALTPVHGESR